VKVVGDLVLVIWSCSEVENEGYRSCNLRPFRSIRGPYFYHLNYWVL